MGMDASPIVYVVDDDVAILEAIRELVSTVGLQVEVFSNAADFLEVCTNDRAGCVILDVRLPNISGLEAQERLLANGIELPVIFVTGYGDVWTAVQAMKKGAFEFLEKPFSSQALLDKIHHAIERDQERRETQVRASEISDRLGSLTRRETDVLIRIGAGKSNKTTARELGVSVRTVEFHRSNLMRKLQATSRESLAEIAFDLLMADGRGKDRMVESRAANAN